MKNKAIKLISIISLLFIFGNWDYYNPENLKSYVRSKYFFEESGLKVEVKIFSKEECKKIFSKDLLNSGYYPMQVVVHNDTDNSYSICPSSIDLNSVEPKVILKAFSKGAFPRKIAYSIIGFFFWPMAIPSTIDGLVSSKLAKIREKSLMAKSVKKEIIPPYSCFTRVIFISKEEMKESFDITLIDAESLKPIIFPNQVSKELIG